MGRTQGEMKESTPAEKATNGPPGPSRLKEPPLRGPRAKNATGMMAKMPRTTYSGQRLLVGSVRSSCCVAIGAPGLYPLTIVEQDARDGSGVTLAEWIVAGCPGEGRFIEAEEFKAGGIVGFFRAHFAVEQSFYLGGLDVIAFEEDAVHVLDLLQPGGPGGAVFAHGFFIDERHGVDDSAGRC